MFVAVQHNISNPEAFWARAKEILPNLPANLKLHPCFPNKTGSRGICIWEGESVKAVQTYLNGQVGHVSSNDYYEVENMEGSREHGSDRAPDGDRSFDEIDAPVRRSPAGERRGTAQSLAPSFPSGFFYLETVLFTSQRPSISHHLQIWMASFPSVYSVSSSLV